MNKKYTNRWHKLTYNEVAELLNGSTTKRLSSKEASDRLKKIGYNTLVRKGKETIFSILLRQFLNPLVFILFAATILAIAMGKVTDGIVIFSVILINAIIGFIQEYQTGNTIAGLLKLVPENATVLRDDEQISIPISELVPGDHVFLQAGDRVSADMRLSFTKNALCDESIITGESFPAEKNILAVAENAGISDRSCMVFSGTLMTSGTAEGIVVATGMRTEIGKIATLLESTKSPKSPLTLSLEKLASRITYIIIIVGILVFLLAILRNYNLSDAALSAITLAVASIPEGLPAVITISATIGVSRMAKRKAIIRHLASVETLGSTTVICADKTGTLTKNEMFVNYLWKDNKEVFIPETGKNPTETITKNSNQTASDTQDLTNLYLSAILCNDATLQRDNATNEITFNGDPTEIALLKASIKFGIDPEELHLQWKRLDELPFDSERKIMVTLHHSPAGDKMLYLKGAPESVIPLLRHSSKKSATSLDEDIRRAVLIFAQKGMRVLAFASKTLSTNNEPRISESKLSGLKFLGLMAMSDPPRLEVRDAIEACHSAGIVVKMITGDHPATAVEIGRQLGITENGKVISGEELQKMKKQGIQRVLEDTHIFARVSPADKLKIVTALQASGEIVAMTGDGVNDAPALKRADIGVAMGISGTAVAKESADMILANDNFESIEAAIEEGRRVFDNILKCLVFLLPTSIGLGLVILISVLFFPSEAGVLLKPMLPVQVLWINLITAVALTLPLALEAKDPDVMKRPPRRPDKPLLSSFIIFRILLVAVIMAGGTIGLFLWEYHVELSKGISHALAETEAQTMATTTMVLFQVFYLLDCRSLSLPIHKIAVFSNPSIYLGIAGVLLAQSAFVYIPFMNQWFHTAPLNVAAWMFSCIAAFSVLIIIGIEKWIRYKYFKTMNVY
ncbi:cation-translocating P-type ATPase [Lunatibacter salilacus]|uniref:cation-translocating P-type ATPase n=1 Tax=Lunatibacter salilacus TaxID=2483804 RepID=UPI00131B9FA6|nr:HAD-IC family P-type ATPase [Lunatibacter salilacus]